MDALDEIRRRLAAAERPLEVLEAFFALAPVGFQIYTREGRSILTNPAFRALFGNEPPPEYNVLKDEILERQGMLNLIHRAFAGEIIHTPPTWYDPRELEQVHVTVGRRAAVAATMFPLPDPSGKVEHIAIIFEDHTDELTARDVAEAERARLHDLFVRAPALIVLARGADLVVELASERLRAFVANRPLEGRPLHDTLPELSDLAQQVRRTGEAAARPEFVLARDFFDLVAQPTFGPGGVDGVLVLAVEVTRSVRAREELAHQKALYETLLQAQSDLGEGFIIADGPSIIYANDAFCSMSGYSPAELVATPVLDIVAPDERDAVDRRLNERLTSAATKEHYETAILHKSGRRVELEVAVKRMERPSEVIVIVRDITARKAAEAERLQLLASEKAARAEAEAAVRARDQFVSVASHELTTPLTALRLQAQTTLRAARNAALTPEKAAAFAENAAKQIDRLARLVADLLDLSRIQAGKLKIEPEDDVDLAAVAREVAGRYAELLAREGSELRLGADAPVVGKWDRLRLEQVMTNLLSNAVKYGKGKPIEVSVEDLGAAARLVVRDQGIGIGAEDQKRIFEPFQRAAPESGYRGLGLGLYIVRQIVEAHRGSVRVESAPGAGATFVVELPKSS